MALAHVFELSYYGDEPTKYADANGSLDFRQSPLANVGGGPILVNDDSQPRTKRLSTG
jgi:hypothetical protein